MSTKHWFLPHNPDVLSMLRDQAAITVDGMNALTAWSNGDAAAARTVRSCEHHADDTKRNLWRNLRDAFSPPLDAEDIYALSADLDEVLNAAKDLVREMEVMDLQPDVPTREMIALLADGANHIAEAFEQLGTKEDATKSADAAVKSQRRLERVYRPAMSALLQVTDIRDVVARREIYRRLSRMGDLIHAVADRVWYAMVKET